jgi:hypothetical protein
MEGRSALYGKFARGVARVTLLFSRRTYMIWVFVISACETDLTA